MTSEEAVRRTETSHAPQGAFEDQTALAASLLRSDDTIANGVIYRDGRIAAMAQTLLEGLGFDANDDLRGLQFTSFWDHSERQMVSDALRRARRGEEMQVPLDLGYIQDCDGRCTVALAPAGQDGLVMMTLHAASVRIEAAEPG